MDEALKLARGCYQRDLIMGYESWSGSSLKGRARDWASSYRRSRKNLLQRLEDAGAAFLTIGSRGKIELRLGRPPGYYVETGVSCGTAWVPGEKTLLDDVVEALDE